MVESMSLHAAYATLIVWYVYIYVHARVPISGHFVSIMWPCHQKGLRTPPPPQYTPMGPLHANIKEDTRPSLRCIRLLIF